MNTQTTAKVLRALGIATALGAMALGGCISVETAKLQLASGIPEQVDKANQEIKAIVTTGKSVNGIQSFTIDERVEFAKLAGDTKAMMELLSEIKYEDDNSKWVKLDVLDAVDLSQPGAAATLLRYFGAQLGDGNYWYYDNWKKQAEVISAKAVEALTEDDIVGLLFGTSGASAPAAADAGNDRRGGRVTAATGRAAPTGTPTQGPANVGWAAQRRMCSRLAYMTQNPDILARMLLGDFGEWWELSGNGDDEQKNALHEDIEKRLLPNVDKISMSIVMRLLDKDTEQYGYTHSRTIKAGKLRNKLIARIPDSDKETLAKKALEHEWDSHKRDKDMGWFELAIICGTLTKDKTTKARIADSIMDKIKSPAEMEMQGFNLTFNPDRAKLTMPYLAKMAGEDWYAAALTKLKCKADFLESSISPTVAAKAMAIGGISSVYVEDALAQQIPPDKITIEMTKALRSGFARKLLEDKMPQKLKDEMAAAAEKEVERIMADAKAKEGETFALGGFYLGMTIDDALILLRHYAKGEKNFDKRRDDEDKLLGSKAQYIFLNGQIDEFARTYTDSDTIWKFNFGPWILRRICDYDVQTDNAWVNAFEKETGLELASKTITEHREIMVSGTRDVGRTVQLTMDKIHTTLIQSSWQHTNPKKQFRLTYFGERKVIDLGTGLSEDGLLLEHYSDISAKEGTLRLQIFRD